MLRTCFGWRLEQPELILTNSGAFLNGVAISDDQLRSIHEVSNDLIVTDDKVLTNLDMLAGIERVGGNVEIRYNSALQDFSGLSGLQSVGGSVNIIGNKGVQNLAGFADLKVIGRFLRVHHNERLELLGGFDSLTRVGRDLSIRGNSRLQSMPRGLSASDSVLSTTCLDCSFRLVDALLLCSVFWPEHGCVSILVRQQPQLVSPSRLELRQYSEQTG